MKTATKSEPTTGSLSRTEPSLDAAAELVVVGIDGSASARGASEWAAAYTSSRGARLVVVHAWSLPTVRRPELLLASSVKVLEEAAVHVLSTETRHLRQLFPELRIDSRLSYGDPSRVLLDAARVADLVVVGSRGAGRIARFLFGSVSQTLATQATAPVLVARGASGTRSGGAAGSPLAVVEAQEQAHLVDRDAVVNAKHCGHRAQAAVRAPHARHAGQFGRQSRPTAAVQ